MSFKQKVFNSLVSVVKYASGLNYPNKISTAFIERIDLVYHVKGEGIDLKIACPNSTNLWRAQTFFTKEPDMIQWINTFNSGCILLDIGANIGLYSMYAAKKGASVVAIEPESQNYGLLNKNIYLNKLSDQISALNIGFGDSNGVEALYIPEFLAGSALNNMGENVNWKKERFNPDFKQNVISFTVDSFLSKYPQFFPTHLKIDVDGIERKIIEGAKDTLKDSRLRELMIELNTELHEDMEILAILNQSGFREISRNNCSEATSEYAKVFNFLFIKS